MSVRVTDIVCPFCATLCDDLECDISDDGKKILEIYNACAIGAEKFMHSQSEDRLVRPRLRQKDGTWKTISYKEAVEYTAQMLANAVKPLMYGWSSTNCEAQSMGSKVGELCGAQMDNTATVCHGSTLLAIQDAGVPSCTLGEIKNRADFILFWGCNPAHAHPRHMSRYSIFPRGFFTGKGYKGRTIVVVDPRHTDTASLADYHLPVEQGRDYELLSALRVVLHGEAGRLPEVVAGIPRKTIIELAEKMKTARFGCIFFGMGVTQSISKNHNIDMAINVTRDLNEFSKWSIMPMRGHYNVTGSGEVWGWQYGYPFCIDLSRGYARYNPGESSSNDLIERGEIDAVFVLGSDPGSHFPFSAVKKMNKLPCVCVDPHITPTTVVADLHVPVAFVGIEVGGCAYRMDSVPIEMHKVVDPPEGVLTDEEFLDKVYERMKEIKGV